MDAVTVFSPAKINLFLAITGRRADGFHELVSVAAPLEFGDRLRVEATEPGETGRGGGGSGDGEGVFSLECTTPRTPDASSPNLPNEKIPPPPMPSPPPGEANLILRAARAFRAASGWRGGAKFFLEKRIPVGAGLGGGSSNATATLRALNQLAARAGRGNHRAPLPDARLAELAAALGSDCALFLHDAPVVMRGRGEQIEPLPAETAQRLRGHRLLVFKPDASVPTAWAYARMATLATPPPPPPAPPVYLPPPDAEARLRRWMTAPPGTAFFGLDTLLFNNMQPAAFAKFIALPVLLEKLRDNFRLPVMMSGSGSACFALLPDTTDAATQAGITGCIHAAWGRETFIVETKIR
ncbi:MAG: 4-(cytidine 5'-diphospho)-2-C-methyl-D-erythritol kinase [Opitutaceae bacterium]|jgi:4-diphosphocytidyl-2-C-methyl-D-erythritol kinase|nr:4-(cytidine 5'-diphospho)-2-C-methyl-D-erythritol kinase [Opitutaceae bacterium]